LRDRADAQGGVPHQITRDAGDQIRPTWSHDRELINFIRRRGNERDVSRMRGLNGPSVQVTHSKTVARSWEAFDGSGVFYQQNPSDAALYFQPIGGGPAKKTIECVTSARFSIGRQGIYYMPCQAGRTIEHDAPVHLLNSKTGEERQLAILKDIQFPVWSRFNGSFSVSADGKTILYRRGGGVTRHDAFFRQFPVSTD
jgi:WD40 repeat protein